MTNTNISRFETSEERQETLGFINSPTSRADPRSQALSDAAAAAENHRGIVHRIPEELQSKLDIVLGADGRTFVYLAGLMGALERGVTFGDTDLSTFTLQAVLLQRRVHMMEATPAVREATLEIERSFGIDLEHADPNRILSIKNVNSILAHDVQNYIHTKTNFLWAMDGVRRLTHETLQRGTQDLKRQAA